MRSISSEVGIEEFQKIDLRVGLVKEAELIPGTRLLRLIVDLGIEERQIIAGLGAWYKPQELKGLKVIVVANLKPKRIRGYVSQGMILAAGTKEDVERGLKPAILTITGSDVPPGTKIT